MHMSYSSTTFYKKNADRQLLHFEIWQTIFHIKGKTAREIARLSQDYYTFAALNKV